MNSRTETETALALLEKHRTFKSGMLNDKSDKNFFRESCMALGRAFAGNEKVDGEPVVNWALRGYQTSIPQKEKYETFAFLMGFSLQKYLKKGAIAFGHRDVGISKKKDEKLDDTLPGSTVVFFEFDPKKENKNSRKNNIWNKLGKIIGEIRTFLKIKKIVGIMPSFFDNKLNPGVMDLLVKRGDELELQMNQFHSKYGPAEKHWYVACVGVDPDNQGKGYGKQLMKQMNSVADRTGRMCYLECATEKNRGFYEKFGYKVVGTEYLSTSDDPIDLEFYLMVRTPDTIKQ